MKNTLQIEDTTQASRKRETSFLSRILFRATLIGLMLNLFLLPHAFGQSNRSGNVRYTLSPMVSGIAWNSDLGLKDGIMYGGKLGIDFGPLIGLEASYLTSGHLWTRFSEIGLVDTAGTIVGENRVTARRFGGDLIIRWPSDRIAPFVRVGGGIIRFEPESGVRAEKIDVRFGGGLDYILSGRLRMRTWVEMNRFRLDRYSLAPGGATSGLYPIDPEADKIKNNLSVGLSLDYALGQSRFGRVTTRERIRPFSVLELEPLMGRLNFDDSKMVPVTVAGARIGGELNPWVGWGVYYWHAMESGLTDTRPLQSYGGETRFSLASKDGPQPYITIGAGQLDFLSGYVDNEGVGRSDRTALILGAGVRAELFSGLQLSAGVQDFMYGEDRLDRISGTSDISHNWLLSGALVFGLGGGGGTAKPGPAETSPVLRAVPETTLHENISTSSVQPESRVDSTVDKSKSTTSPTQTGYVSEKNIVIPVPLEGEIYIRYGKGTRNVETSVIEVAPEPQTMPSDSLVINTPKAKIGIVDSAKVDQIAPPPDTATPTPPVSIINAPAPVTRNELDSLINVLRSDISAMLTTPTPAPPTSEPSVSPIIVAEPAPEDSLIVALKTKLAESEQERGRLDSLLRIPVPVAEPTPDTLAEQRIQKAIADQVAAALAARPATTEKEITQADLQTMMAALSARMDSVTSQRAAIDSVRLRDQLQLEITRQTKSQEEFQRATEQFLQKYGQRLDEKSATPAPIIITQPAQPFQAVESGSPSTVVIRPDTQFVVIRDSTGREGVSLPISTPDISVAPEKKDFIDLRPTGYIGFGLEKPKQFILGGRLDIGPITAKEKRLRLVPEFALGLGGGGISVMAVMNAEYGITNIKTGNYTIVPYARMGFGVLGFGGDIEGRDTEGVLNFTYGISIDPRKNGVFRGLGNPAFIAEHQIIDLFDLNRIVIGLQWSR